MGVLQAQGKMQGRLLSPNPSCEQPWTVGHLDTPINYLTANATSIWPDVGAVAKKACPNVKIAEGHKNYIPNLKYE